MSEANKTQVGGDHYKASGAGLQHWDVVLHFKLDYFQGQITKYLLRWRDKHDTHEGRVQDLKKARHFLDKYIETAREWDGRATADFVGKVLDEYMAASQHAESVVGQIVAIPDWCTVEGYYGDLTQEYKCRACGWLGVAPRPPEYCPACHARSEAAAAHK